MTPFVRWFEIPATDFERAVTFYRAVFHVELDVENFMGSNMAMFDRGEGAFTGCIIQSPELQPGSSGSRIYLDGGPDMDALLARIEPAGGKIVLPRTSLPDGNGDFALFADTEGNTIGLHVDA